MAEAIAWSTAGIAMFSALLLTGAAVSGAIRYRGELGKLGKIEDEIVWLQDYLTQINDWPSTSLVGVRYLAFFETIGRDPALSLTRMEFSSDELNRLRGQFLEDRNRLNDIVSLRERIGATSIDVLGTSHYYDRILEFVANYELGVRRATYIPRAEVF